MKVCAFKPLKQLYSAVTFAGFLLRTPSITAGSTNRALYQRQYFYIDSKLELYSVSLSSSLPRFLLRWLAKQVCRDCELHSAEA